MFDPYQSLAEKFERFFELKLFVLTKFHIILSRSKTKSFTLHEYRGYLVRSDLNQPKKCSSFKKLFFLFQTQRDNNLKNDAVTESPATESQMTESLPVACTIKVL